MAVEKQLMDRRLVHLSRTVSHALRHAPWQYELELDDAGWVDIDALLAALQNHRAVWEGVSEADLQAILAQSDKRRFEIHDGRIRALYGHSVPQKIAKTPTRPPDTLYHGTTQRVLPIILADGLKPMRRQRVHLSCDIPTAEQVARRKGSDIVVLRVDAAAAYAQGIPFYQGNETIWLADSIPAAYLSTVG